MTVKRFPQGLVLMLLTLMVRREQAWWSIDDLLQGYAAATGESLAHGSAASSLNHMVTGRLAVKTRAGSGQRFYRLTGDGKELCYWATAALARAWGCDLTGGAGERGESKGNGGP